MISPIQLKSCIFALKLNIVEQFIPDFSIDLKAGDSTWKSPSNIALVKYWGKKGDQLPANPSVSFTLSEATTQTNVKWTPKSGADAKKTFLFEGEENPKFGEKTFRFFEKIKPYAPWLDELDLIIDTNNTFPHSSGIASSASGMSAMALNVMSMEKQLNPNLTEDYFYQKASFLARIGSGSACRSVYGGLVEWGQTPSIQSASDMFGIPYPNPVDAVFQDYQDTILLVDVGQKKVSSTVGHGLLQGHPFGESRYQVAHQNLDNLASIFQSGDLEGFIKIVESEALMLHALMMSSQPYFILMKPNTLAIIEKIWAYREETKIPVCFTLDAGANVHMLYPAAFKQNVLEFVNAELVGYCQKKKYLCDSVGSGPQQQ